MVKKEDQRTDPPVSSERSEEVNNLIGGVSSERVRMWRLGLPERSAAPTKGLPTALILH
jgi:hypothetical protein